MKSTIILSQYCLGNFQPLEMSSFRFSDVIAEARNRPTDSFLLDQLVKGLVLLPVRSRFCCIAPFPTRSTYLIPFFPSKTITM